MFKRLATAVTGRPWWVIGAWLVASAAVLVFAPGLGEVTTADQRPPATAEGSRAAALARAAFPDQPQDGVVVVVTRVDGGVLAPADLERIGTTAMQLNRSGIAGVRAAMFDPARSVSPNGAVALVNVGLDTQSQSAAGDVVTDVRALLTTVFEGSGLSGGVTGEAAVAVDNAQAIRDAERVVTIATLVLIVALLLLIFRSPVAAALPLAAVGLVYAVSTALIATVAKALDLTVGQEVPTMLIVVLFGIGTDYVLFLLFRYRERRRAGDTPTQAIVVAVERIGEAVFSAGFAVIAGFSVLALAALGFFATLGPALAVAVAVMVLAALTLIPAVITVLGRAVFWPSRLRGGAGRRSASSLVGRAVARRPLVAVVTSGVVLCGLALGALAVRPDYDPISQLPSDAESTQAFEVLKAGFPAGAIEPTRVYLTAPRPLDEVEVGSFVRALANVAGVATPLTPQISADATTIAVPLVLSLDPYSGAALDLVSGPLRDAAHASAPAGSSVLVGGQTMMLADVRDATNRDLALIFPIAGAIFVLILAGLLRAALAPVYLVAMVVAGFAATLGASALLFQGVLGRDGLSFTLPIIVYLFVTAIGTDYNILITARLREEVREGRHPRDAAALAIAHAGPSVASAALILAGTFAALMLSGVPFFMEIGFAVTVGIIIVAFVVSLVLVPAVTALSGRAAWWPGYRPPGAWPAEMGGAGVEEPESAGAR
jgi:RND superfamily putative drug exporter